MGQAGKGKPASHGYAPPDLGISKNISNYTPVVSILLDDEGLVLRQLHSRPFGRLVVTAPRRFATSYALEALLASETLRSTHDARIAEAIAALPSRPVPSVPSWHWLSETEAAERWRIAPRTMRRRRVAWRIPATKVGRSWLYHPCVFERIDAVVMAMFAEFANEANAAVQKAA